MIHRGGRTNSTDTYVTVPIDVHIGLSISLSLSSVYISMCLIHVYVYVNVHTHFLPLPHSYTTITISICTYVSIIVKWPFIMWILQLQYVSMYLLLQTSPDAYTLVNPCSRVSISIFIRVYSCSEYTHTMFMEICLLLYAPPLSICAFFNIIFIRIYSIHLNTCSCVHAYTKSVQSKYKKYM